MNKFIKLACASALCVSSAGAFAASTAAANYSHSDTTNWGNVDPGNPAAVIIDVDKFDASLGTLTGVWINWSIDTESTGTIQNNSTSPETIGASIQTDIFMQFNDTLEQGTVFYQQPPSTFAPAQIKAFGPLNGGDMGMASIVTDLGAWTGPGTIGINAYTTGFFGVFGTTTNADVNVATIGGLDFDVIYHYDEPPSGVPVPGAVWLFGTGLFGLMGVARRKKARV